MAAARHVIALLRSHIEGDDEQFLSVAAQMAAHEARQGHSKLAVDLKNLIETARRRRASPAAAPERVAQPVGELGKLVSAALPKTKLKGMSLSDDIERSLGRILHENRQKPLLSRHGLSPRRKILLAGPPGSGKTMTASALAGELGLPLYTVVFDSLINRFLGETASRMRIVFDAMSDMPGVYLFDEFDAIGARRGDTNDIGEIRRVLNSFLQFLEADGSDSLIVAATNLPELLDAALFRRFDDVIRYTLPDEGVAKGIMQNELGLFKTGGVDWDVIVDEASGLSHAELSLCAQDAAKRAALSDRSEVTHEDLAGSVAERQRAAAFMVDPIDSPQRRLRRDDPAPLTG